MAFVIGWAWSTARRSPGAFVVALVAGTVLNYVVGVAMFCALTQSTLAAGITACVLPFIPTAIIKRFSPRSLDLQKKTAQLNTGAAPFLRSMQGGLLFACRYSLSRLHADFSVDTAKKTN